MKPTSTERLHQLCQLSIDGDFDKYFIQNIYALDLDGKFYYHDKVTDLVMSKELIFCIRKSPKSVLIFGPEKIQLLYKFLIDSNL